MPVRYLNSSELGRLTAGKVRYLDDTELTKVTKPRLPYDIERNPIPASRYNEPPAETVGDPLTRGVSEMAIPYLVANPIRAFGEMVGSPDINRFRPPRPIPPEQMMAEPVGGKATSVIAGGIEKGATKIFDPAPARGKYAKPVESAKELLDPARFYQLFGEAAPLMAGLGVASAVNPALGAAAMFGGESGEIVKDMDAYEAKRGVKIDPDKRKALMLAGGGVNAGLEFVGLHKLMGVAKLKGLRQRIVGALTAFGTEVGTEGAQGDVSLLTKDIYDAFEEYGVGEYAKEFYRNALAAVPVSLVAAGGGAAVGKNEAAPVEEDIEQPPEQPITRAVSDEAPPLVAASKPPAPPSRMGSIRQGLEAYAAPLGMQGDARSGLAEEAAQRVDRRSVESKQRFMAKVTPSRAAQLEGIWNKAKTDAQARLKTKAEAQLQNLDFPLAEGKGGRSPVNPPEADFADAALQFATEIGVNTKRRLRVAFDLQQLGEKAKNAADFRNAALDYLGEQGIDLPPKKPAAPIVEPVAPPVPKMVKVRPVEPVPKPVAKVADSTPLATPPSAPAGKGEAVDYSSLEGKPDVYWHGTPSGDMRGGTHGLHIGTRLAAKEALEARIGVPVSGEWDGTREYGKTLLAGKKTLRKMGESGKFLETGYNSGKDVPEADYYPPQRKERANYSDASLVSMDAKPDVFPVKIKGQMSNSPKSPHRDFSAGGRMAGLLKKGNAKSGYYYENVGEDAGSISAVVPSGSHVERLTPSPAVKPAAKGKGEARPEEFRTELMTLDEYKESRFTKLGVRPEAMERLWKGGVEFATEQGKDVSAKTLRDYHSRYGKTPAEEVFPDLAPKGKGEGKAAEKPAEPAAGADRSTRQARIKKGLKSDEGAFNPQDNPELWNDIIAEAKDIVGDVKMSADELAAKLKEAFGDLWDAIAPHLDKLRAAMQPPEKKEAAGVEAKGDQPPRFTKIQIATDRDIRGMNELDEHERQKWAVNINNAREQGLDRASLNIAQEYLAAENPRALNADEIAGLYLGYTGLRNLESDIQARLENVQDKRLNEIDVKQLDAIQGQMGIILEAIDKTHPIAGRSVAIFNLSRDVDDYSLPQMERVFKAVTKRDANPKEREAMKRTSEKFATTTKRLKANEKTRPELERKVAAKKAEKLAQHEIAKAASADRTEAARQVSLKKIDRLLKELGGMGARLNDITGLAPEAIWKIGQVAFEYGKIYGGKLPPVVAAIKGHLPDLTTEDVHQAILSTNPKAKQRAVEKNELAIRSLKKQARMAQGLTSWGERQSTRLSAETNKRERDYQENKRVADKTASDKRAKIDKDLQEYVARQHVRIAAERNKQVAKEAEAARQERIKKLEAELKAKEEQAKKDKALADYVAQQLVRVVTERHKKIVLPLSLLDLRVKKLLRDLRAEAYYGGWSRKQLQEIQTLIAKAIDQLSTGDPEGAKKYIKELTGRLDTHKQIADLQNQIASGEFKQPVKPERIPDPPEIRRDKMILADLKRRHRIWLAEKSRSRLSMVAGGALGVSRTFKTAMDMGAGLVQAIVLAPTQPKLFAASWQKAFTAYWSQKTFEELDYDLRNSEAQYDRNRMGIKLHDKEMGVLEGEADLAHKLLNLPGLNIPKAAVDMGERFYATFVNHFRAGLADQFVRNAPNATEAELQAMGNYINVFTRRGGLKGFEMAATTLSNVFFAPRFAVSAFQIPYKTAFGYWQTPRVRKEMLKAMAGFTASVAMSLALAKLAGLEVEDDPFDPDYGRIQIGDTRIDLTGGLITVIRMMHQVLDLGLAHAGFIDLSKKNARVNPLDLLTDYAQMRLNSSIQMGSSLITGKDWRGQPISVPGALLEGFTPLFISDAKDAWRENGMWAGLGAGAASFTGVRLTTYPRKSTGNYVPPKSVFGSQGSSGLPKLPTLPKMGFNQEFGK